MNDTPEYQEVNLLSKADAYIMEKINWPRTLSQILVNEIDITNAQKTTYLPSDVDVDTVPNFAATLHTHRKLPIEWIVGKMSDYLKKKSNLIIFQDSCTRPEDPWIVKKNMRTFLHSCNNEAYFVLTSEHHKDLQVIKKVLDHADDFFFVGLLTSLPEETKLPKELTIPIIEQLVQRTEYVLISVFDQESYILCTLNE